MFEFWKSETIRKPRSLFAGFLIAFVICHLSFVICLAALAATQADIKKYPPVSGDIYGQAAPGVRSVSVNGKPVAFDAGGNFRAPVKLAAGEKYLTLTINYEGLRVIKKYLIVRKSEVNVFKVFVPKEKIEKSIAEVKAARKTTARKKKPAVSPETLRARERARQLAAQKEKERQLAAQREKERLLAAREKAKQEAIQKEKELAAAREKVRELAVQKEKEEKERRRLAAIKEKEHLLAAQKELLAAREKERESAKQKAKEEKERERLAAIKEKERLLAAQEELLALKEKELERQKAEAEEKERALKEAIAKLPMPGPRTFEYLYVWEFSEGKLLAVKEKQGKYSAEIYIPVEKQWLNLKGLSDEDLKELIERPVGVKKKK
ncbi:hypothetical protein A2625_06220 [candidate division WOR-1 bacterium RIFCSPHIGHO2_01_FULL_53_15]|uniref:Uncharacterized protein n=1 Tax=candidate division WOR-1 bacterium RIFCSPHIGHO2_01_FULL_53_15 TaxID=1802564 RepID=A0A1F4Q0Y9_UNCSA|nr:MAG: hypothetical protein A2625_06220 [candidate division WOR-1 bacterium RIFCSPHIGHO2_01_FULL_53_15]OGC13818.1 MAG: hypothetical protein A3D23_02000 [candidate division WOR-1 bacterium RIFCSPHIGHO2_02_FULL_53_26]